jgi:vancomycin resistance protein YoaR
MRAPVIAIVLLAALATEAGAATPDSSPPATMLRGPGAAAAPVDTAPAPTVIAPAGEYAVTLGAFSTTLVGSLPDRTHNVQLAAGALDGAVLRPGEELSFNRLVGARTAERGYRPAPVILREVRQIQVGGGVCQVASTLLDAALLAGLTVVERHRHSSPVDYVALGEDATIAWSVKDLRLRNDLDQDVRLRIEVLGSTLAARLEAGEETGETFELVTLERESPAPDDVAGLPGRDVELYRVRARDGEELARELVHRDHYPPSRTRAGTP